MSKPTAEQVRDWIAKRPDSLAGMKLVRRDDDYAIERNDGATTMWTGTLNECWLQAWAYSQGYCDAKSRFHKE